MYNCDKLLKIQYGESRPTTASGLVDAPLIGVEVSYRDDDESNKKACVGISDAVCSCDTMCTCGSVSVTDTSCSLYLPLRDGLQYEEDDDIPVTVVVQVSNGKTTTESEIVLNGECLKCTCTLMHCSCKVIALLCFSPALRSEE